MTNSNENIDSLNDTTTAEDIGKITDVGELKAKLEKTLETNRQLYARAKKGEGFELKDGNWVKKQVDASPTSPKKEPSNGKVELDWGQKAYLKSSGFNPEEFEDVQQAMIDTGKPLEEVIESKWFNAGIKEKRDLKASRDATPDRTQRSGTSTRDSVDYWLAKDEMPPKDMPKLREDWVNAKVEKEKSVSVFTDTPVVK